MSPAPWWEVRGPLAHPWGPPYLTTHHPSPLYPSPLYPWGPTGPFHAVSHRSPSSPHTSRPNGSNRRPTGPSGLGRGRPTGPCGLGRPIRPTGPLLPGTSDRAPHSPSTGRHGHFLKSTGDMKPIDTRKIFILLIRHGVFLENSTNDIGRFRTYIKIAKYNDTGHT